MGKGCSSPSLSPPFSETGKMADNSNSHFSLAYLVEVERNCKDRERPNIANPLRIFQMTFFFIGGSFIFSAILLSSSAVSGSAEAPVTLHIAKLPFMLSCQRHSWWCVPSRRPWDASLVPLPVEEGKGEREREREREKLDIHISVGVRGGASTMGKRRAPCHRRRPLHGNKPDAAGK